IERKDFSAANHIRYSLQNDSADAYAINITMRKGGYQFDVFTSTWTLNDVQLNMGGMHNVENAIAAIVIAHHLKIDDDKIKNAVSAFKGVKRRFEYIIEPNENDAAKNKIIYVDDYAHHPQELNALIAGAKTLFSDRKCTIVFQPHLFSRTKDFAKEFAESLDQADEIFLLPIYPARELPMEGVTSNLILDQMKNKNSRILTKEELLKYLQNIYLKSDHERELNDHERELNNVFITSGAGDIDQLVLPIKEILMPYTR
nr:Mur ligase family protein [Bacteroidota bacterium]